MRTTLIASMVRMSISTPTVTWNAIYNRHKSVLRCDYDGDTRLTGKTLAYKHHALGNR